MKMLTNAFLFFFALPLRAATITVDSTGGGDFAAIQPAIDAAVDGDTVLVKPGEYVITEPINFNRLHTDDPASPPIKSIAVVSEGGPVLSVIRKFGLQTEAFYRCVILFDHGEDASSLLRGFTLTSSAYEQAGGGDSTGIGVICNGSSPTIERCIVTGNVATGSQSGGGIFCQDGSPTIVDCDIVGNSTGYDTDSGGGITCHGSSPRVIGCRIVGNSARSASGGGVHCHGSPSAVFTDCTIMGNVASTGGGMQCSGSSPTLINCLIAGNAAESGGGLNSNSNLTLLNCTIAQNFASDGCQDVCCSSGLFPFTNCIIGEGFSAEVSHSLVMGLEVPPGPGNMNGDPLFAKGGVFDFKRTRTLEIDGHEFILPDFIIEAPDYHLLSGSPAIDAGASEGAPSTDIEGHGRPCGAGVEIGAYESGDCAGTQPFIRGDSNADGVTDIGDAVAILGYLFLGEKMVPCEQAGDANDDGLLDITDAISVLSLLFLGGMPIEPPVGTCGVDLTGHQLPCVSFPGCR